MGWHRSFIIRLFMILLIVFLVLLGAAGTGIYSYARQTVGEEFRHLNQASLAQLAEAAGESLENVLDFGEKVSVNSRLLQYVDHTDEASAKEVHTIVESLLTGFGGRSRLEVYILGKNGLVAGSYNTNLVSWEQLQADERLRPLLEGETDRMLLPTQRNEGGAPIMTYSFHVIYAMHDLLTGEELGYVILEVSELLLYEQYRDFAENDTRISMVTSDGVILSNKNKQLIGSDYWQDQEENWRRPEAQGESGQLFLYERIPGSDWYLAEQIPQETAFGALTKLKNAVVLSVLAATLLFAGAIMALSRQILSRVMEIRGKMEKVVEGDLSVRIAEGREDEFGSMERAFNAMVEEIDRLIWQARQSEHQKRVAEMDFLHAQINSHFIHNTLTSIRFMLEMGQDKRAGEMVFYFSKLLRKTLSRSDEFISLEEEIDTLQSYVAIQQYRYPYSFEVTYEIAPETKRAMVPTLILQPVVENAIFHTVGHSFTHICIRSRRAGTDLELTVEDDGVGMDSRQQALALEKGSSLNRVGLQNVHERIQLNYGRKYGLRIDSTVGAGTKITFLLPCGCAEKGESGWS
ncbi:MAG: sensor histidine kinase [Lachnospiraceae bacterium]|jgi:two-component system sensor histidine kinase YesM|nr:sensor histidine kinase [Lachnospiraceae bacterium]